MSRYLLIANETLGGQDLLDELEQRVDDDTSFHVLVPVSEPEDPTTSGVAGGGATSTAPTASPDAKPTAKDEELSPSDAARHRLDEALEQVERLGAPVDGEIVTDDAVDAAARAVSQDTFDEILVSTPPPSGSQLLNRDLISQIESRVDVPVTHIYGPRGDVRESE